MDSGQSGVMARVSLKLKLLQKMTVFKVRQGAEEKTVLQFKKVQAELENYILTLLKKPSHVMMGN